MCTLAQYLSQAVEVKIKRPIPMAQKMTLIFEVEGLRSKEGEWVAQAIPTEINADQIEILTSSEVKHLNNLLYP